MGSASIFYYNLIVIKDPCNVNEGEASSSWRVKGVISLSKQTSPVVSNKL